MALTVCRVYNLGPEDISVDKAAGQDEYIVRFGDSVSIQGPWYEVRALLNKAIERGNLLHFSMPPRTDEPF